MIRYQAPCICNTAAVFKSHSNIFLVPTGGFVHIRAPSPAPPVWP